MLGVYHVSKVKAAGSMLSHCHCLCIGDGRVPVRRNGAVGLRDAEGACQGVLQ